MMKNKSTFYKLLFFTYMTVLVCLMTLTIKTGDIDIPKEFLGIGLDKIVHFSLFFPYSFIVWMSFNVALTRNFGKWAFFAIAISGILLGATTDFAQFFNPDRSYDPKDMLANFLAVVCGTLFLAVICSIRRYIGNSRIKN